MRAVNLIPAEHRSGAAVGAGQSEGAIYAVLGALAGIAVLALLYGSAHRDISSRQGEATRLTAQAQQARSAAAGLAPYTSFVAMRAQRTQAVSTLVDSRFDWAHVFHEFGRVLPLGISITALEGTVGATTPGGAPVAAAPTASTTPAPSSSSSASTASASASSAAGSTPTATGSGSASAPAVASATPTGSVPTFLVTGCATSQREVAVMLERLRLMDGVASVTLNSSTKSAATGSTTGSGGCPSGTPTFSAHIEFQPLPAAPAKGAAATTIASTGTAATGSAKSPAEASAK